MAQNLVGRNSEKGNIIEMLKIVRDLKVSDGPRSQVSEFSSMMKIFRCSRKIALLF